MARRRELLDRDFTLLPDCFDRLGVRGGDEDLTENRRRELEVSRRRLAEMAFRKDGMEKTTYTLTIRDVDTETCYIDSVFDPPLREDFRGRPQPMSCAEGLGRAVAAYLNGLVKPARVEQAGSANAPGDPDSAAPRADAGGDDASHDEELRACAQD